MLVDDLISHGPNAVRAVARFTGSNPTYLETWGSAALPPRLYALARFAG